MIHLDTHVVVWLYLGQRELLSATAANCIEADDVCVSPMVLLELEYLREIGRLRVDADAIYTELNRNLGLTVCPREFHAVVAHARAQTWTRDPFDRLIVGQAVAADALLVTRDTAIRTNYARAVW